MALYKKIDFTFYLTKTILKDLKQKQNIDVFTISQCIESTLYVSCPQNYIYMKYMYTMK